MKTKPDKIRLSVAIIAKDEEPRLPGCLESVSFSDDIVVVVDSGSKDGTAGIANKFGCKVYIEDWKGFGPQKQSAIDKTLNNWVLILDADERVPPETKEAIISALENPTAGAYSFRRKNHLHGRWIKHSDWWPDRQIRLVDKSKGCFRTITHERWVTSGEIENLDAHIEHFSFRDYSEMNIVLDEYSTASAQEMFEKGKRANPLTPVYHGLWAFLKTYFIKRGFLDGMDGLVISLNKGAGAFFKYAKLLELQNRKDR
jgi:glycosyltransferase involved in cell wall biosynthesis